MDAATPAKLRDLSAVPSIEGVSLGRKCLNEIVRLVTNPRRGRAVIYNSVMWIGGQTATDKSEGIEGQTRQALAKIDSILEEAGSDRTRLLSAQIWLRDITADFSGFNATWDAWIGSDHAPARATAQCAMRNG